MRTSYFQALIFFFFCAMIVYLSYVTSDRKYHEHRMACQINPILWPQSHLGIKLQVLSSHLGFWYYDNLFLSKAKINKWLIQKLGEYKKMQDFTRKKKNDNDKILIWYRLIWVEYFFSRLIKYRNILHS